jgi:hypothetical protein
MEQISTNAVAESIVNTLLEEIDADFPSHKSEVRILPTDDPRRFDVTLLTGFDPVYIGTLGHQGNVWKPVEVMPGIGREMRAKLHFVGPNKEDVAMAMVQALRPIWKRKIAGHLTDQMESEEVDPKAFVQQKIGHDIDIRRVIETNYPNVEVLDVRAEADYKLRYVVTIRSKNPAQPLWHQPIYSMIQDLEKKLWDVYGWKMRPYANQQKYPENVKTGGIAGIKPISICYNTATGVHGTINLIFDFDILRKDSADGYEEESNWGTPYESMEDGNEVDPKEFALKHTRYVYIVREADHMAQWLNNTAWPKQKLKTAVTAVFRHKRNALNYASNMGGRVYSTPEDSTIVKAWLSTGQPIRESSDIDPKQFSSRIPEFSLIEDMTARGYTLVHLDAVSLSSNGLSLQFNSADFEGIDGNVVPAVVSKAKADAEEAISKAYPGAVIKEWQSPGFDSDFDVYFIPSKISEPMTESCSAKEIEKEADKAEKPTSPEQAEAGNYKKGHVCVQGLEIAIENAKGSTRSGTNKQGKKWSVTLPAHYGYIKGTQGKDKDHLDVYIGPKPGGIMAFVVNQVDDSEKFDEHKIMLGFESKDEAIETYDRAFTGNLGSKLRQSVVSTTVDGLKAWIASGNTKKPFEGLAESLLEADEEYGFEQMKALMLRAGDAPQPGTKFHLGFAISTSDEHTVEARANDDAVEVDWEAINAAITVIERNALAALREQGIACQPEGHDANSDLIGSAWVEAGTGAMDIMKEFIETGEPFRTGSGSIDHIQHGLSTKLYQGVPGHIAALIDVDISFFDINAAEMGIEESDIKSLAMRANMRDPKVWGDLNVGDVVFVPETGCYERIDALKDGYGTSHQDVNGHIVYNRRFAQFRMFSQFGPAYAYGHYIQHLSAHPQQGLLGAQLVEPSDTSDEGLWKLVDEEMQRNGTTPEELEGSRNRHREWLDQPQQRDARAARERLDRELGRLPAPPQNESEGVDPKAFLGGHELPVDLEPIHDNAWYAYRREDHYPLGQLHFDLHDDAPTPEARANWADTNWIAMPITPSVQPKAFNDQDEALQFLLQHGNR